MHMTRREFHRYVRGLGRSQVAWLRRSIAWADIAALVRQGEYDLAVICIEQWLG
jgi:hypothetical protein